MNENKVKKNPPEQEVQEDAVSTATEHADSAMLSDKKMADVTGGFAPSRPLSLGREQIKIKERF